MATKKNTKQKKKIIDQLSMWEWDTLVGAWRYYEYGTTATSACFPRDIIERYWGEGNNYSDKVRMTIANQFAITDHWSKGEKDWSECKYSMDCDKRAWITFYRFCEAWVKGFTPITVKDPDTKNERAIMCFHVDWNNRWMSRDKFIEWGDNHYVAPEYIVHIPERVK